MKQDDVTDQQQAEFERRGEVEKLLGESREWRGSQETSVVPEPETEYKNPMADIPSDDENPKTAVINIAPGQDLAIQKLLDEIMRVKELSDRRLIKTSEDARLATNDLSIMKHLKDELENKRKEYVGPVKDYAKSIDEAFKLLSGPLGEADRITRRKLLEYDAEMDRKRREAEEVNRQALEVARKQAELNNGEFTVDTTPVEIPAPAPERVRAELGTAGKRDNWKWEVIDFSILPDAYKVVDSSLLTAIARKHHDQKPIDGVRFYNEPGLQVTTRK